MAESRHVTEVRSPHVISDFFGDALHCQENANLTVALLVLLRDVVAELIRTASHFATRPVCRMTVPSLRLMPLCLWQTGHVPMPPFGAMALDF